MGMKEKNNGLGNKSISERMSTRTIVQPKQHSTHTHTHMQTAYLHMSWSSSASVTPRMLAWCAAAASKRNASTPLRHHRRSFSQLSHAPWHIHTHITHTDAFGVLGLPARRIQGQTPNQTLHPLLFLTFFTPISHFFSFDFQLLKPLTTGCSLPTLSDRRLSHSHHSPRGIILPPSVPEAGPL